VAACSVLQLCKLQPWAVPALVFEYSAPGPLSGTWAWCDSAFDTTVLGSADVLAHVSDKPAASLEASPTSARTLRRRGRDLYFHIYASAGFS
jgi:hypothetical protein